MKISSIAMAILASTALPFMGNAAESAELAEVKQELKEIKQQLEKDREAKDSAIKIGGAVRFQYGVKDYDTDDKERGGDFDFDVFRLDFNGTIGDVTLSAQYRWYQYMEAVHHAYVAYQFNENWQGQVGITQVPFGNLTYNSNSFFFSSNFYVGLEDDYDAGLSFIGNYDKHDIRIAFFKTDELGGIDGYVSDRTDRYSYDIVGTRPPGEGLYDTPQQGLADDSTLNLRYAYKFDNFELGASLLLGGIEGEEGNAGEHNAYAFHAKGNVDNLGIMFQYTDYEYDLNEQADFVAVGAYAFYDTIPASATIYNLNLSYSLPVDFGPISNLTFYNDYNLMTDKSGDLKEDTMMNVTGVMVTSGNLYTLIDYAVGKNQPFLGGSMGGDSDATNKRININFGYYF
ncbi:carbohydrate porin [Pseudoalteromonas sp. K222D]|uniref:porin n=1 Tax=Pseudoalteromonas sp. K222D TaxID=2820756 RepID=UPI000EC49580|nr:porin [Pseudoalteromonas sp. K222D]MBO7927147.1 carbohydrate porin [Pseudoalteromonas sp. K222D]HCP96667.1 hypothetical protein [Pseudoalteromonas sp.]|tara:strand:+ start:10636 stop:11835 length:1200 start_codon:yes stop_codon:yes gene_type:complete